VAKAPVLLLKQLRNLRELNFLLKGKVIHLNLRQASLNRIRSLKRKTRRAKRKTNLQRKEELKKVLTSSNKK
jgi:hypothetical protein